MATQPIIIAVCGKGGVGKTSLSALIVRMFAGDPALRVLAVDADPAVGLSYALGIPVANTVDRIRKTLIDRLGAEGIHSKEALIREMEYQLFEALGERQNLAFLAIGRPEGEGCFCRVNTLLRDLIKETAAAFDLVVIDGEAGLEQIQRRVMAQITHLLMVSDASLKGRRVAETIQEVGEAFSGLRASGIIYNRLKSGSESKEILRHNRLPLVHVMLENEHLRDFDRQGRPLLDLPWSDELSNLEADIRRFVGMPGSNA